MKALEGVRVLDLTRLLPGPYATMILATLGARVDKVEEPTGDPVRHLAALPGAGGASGPDGASLFDALNRGKRSICLDLKTEAGKRALLAMAGQSDVLVEQFRPGTLERLGLSPSVLAEKNPRLIVCRLTGYGQEGPLAKRAGHDLNYLARSGVLGMQGPRDGLPTPPGFQLADIGGALYTVIAIQAALAEREKSGRGQVVDVAMLDATLGFAIASWSSLLGGNSHARGDEPLTGGLAVYRTYETKDGKWVALASLEPKFWQSFSEGVGIPFDPAVLLPGPHQGEWHARLATLFRTKTREEWALFGETHDCCLEPVLTPMEASNDAHVRGRGHFGEGGGGLPVLPFAYEERHATARAPKLGEHTAEALREVGLEGSP